MLALPALGSEVNSDPSLFLSAAARSVQAASLGAPLLGGSDRSKITIVAARASGPLTAAVISVRPDAISPDGKAAELSSQAMPPAKPVIMSHMTIPAQGPSRATSCGALTSVAPLGKTNR
jgi:hypothetical protein